MGARQLAISGLAATAATGLAYLLWPTGVEADAPAASVDLPAPAPGGAGVMQAKESTLPHRVEVPKPKPTAETDPEWKRLPRVRRDLPLSLNSPSRAACMDAQYLFRCFQLNPGDVYIEPEHRAKLTTRLEAFKESLWRHSDETNKLANAEMVDLMAAGKATPLIERKTDKRTVFLAEQLRQKRRENLRKILLRSAKRPKSPNAHLLDNEMALEARLDKKVPADWWPSGAQYWVGGDGGYICKRGEDGGLYSATLDMLPKTKEARQNSKRTLNAMADVIVNWFVDRGAFPRERAGELLDWCYRGLDIRKRMADPALRERTMELLRIAPR